MKAQVATTVSPESEMLLKTIGALPRACGREVAGTIRAGRRRGGLPSRRAGSDPEVAHLKPGERVLVHGALGGLASAFPGVARPLGAASVTGTARSSSLAAARASALPYDEVIASEDILAALGEQRFDVVIEPVG